MFWLLWYYRDSKVAIQVESTGTEGDRSINDLVTIVLMSSSLVWKNQKEKKWKQEEEREEDDENEDKNMIKWFWKWYWEQSKKEKKTHGY